MASGKEVNVINFMELDNSVSFTVAAPQMHECLQQRVEESGRGIGIGTKGDSNGDSSSDELVGIDDLLQEFEPQEWCQGDVYGSRKSDLRLSGSQLGDVPTEYLTSDLYPHELPVMGTYVDPRIVPGFSYTVRRLEEDMSKRGLRKQYLFRNQALRLQSIGVGYGKRITFASRFRNRNDNYFWSDTHPGGYGFAIQVVNEGDKFTMYDANRWPWGTCEVMKILGTQYELSQTTDLKGRVDKCVKVTLLSKVELYDCGTCNVQKLTGIAVASRPDRIASIVKIKDVSVNHHRGLTLVPGVDDKMRRLTVMGDGVPAQYTVTGLEAYEIPAIGTFIDPRITPGFTYKVRPAHAKRPLFQNRALTLVGIGMGYGKRLTFESDKRNVNDNILWSDSYPDGIGFAIEAVAPGLRFAIQVLSCEGAQDLGIAQIFSLVGPQVEESHEILPNGDVEKRVRVDVMCDLSFSSTNPEDTKTVRISGMALLRKPINARKCHVVGITSIGLGSQLNIMFAQSGSSLYFRNLL